MCEIISFQKYRRARLDREVIRHRARPTGCRHEAAGSFVQIGVVSAEILRRLNLE